ncbi:MAG: electron transfer flavoprotein subunit alpha/FixB family protein [Candidatus Bathyarchaeota archaeon]|nr:MAG: electron transfer flavoprotein subunit alpha/FixB family protein [Candidatus Bathyarchaeota archaeon]
MSQIFVLVEQRQGEIRDITFEMLTKGKDIAGKLGGKLTALLLGNNVKELAKPLTEYADEVLLIEEPWLEDFNSDTYQQVLSDLIHQFKPYLTLIGHTSYGVELAPRLAVSLKLPLATDCVDLRLENQQLTVTRQVFGGKVNVDAIFNKADGYIATVRQAAFPKEEAKVQGAIKEISTPPFEEGERKRFIEYRLPPPGGVDITASDILIGVGRGIKDESEVPAIEELAKVLRGVLACSRPIVDKGWLPNDRQVGSSGKTVKPKLYFALGISGAFQHILGMKESDLIIAVNKDPNAPIFSTADYGIVDDLFKIVPALKQKIGEMKA